jgi:hypothetical protein
VEPDEDAAAGRGEPVGAGQQELRAGRRVARRVRVRDAGQDEDESRLRAALRQVVGLR